MIRLIVSNLVKRPTRTVVCILAVALGIALILVVVGLCYGQLNDSAERTRRVGGDIMFRPSDSSAMLAISSSTLQVQIGSVLERIEGVEAATPVLAKFVFSSFHLIYGIEPVSFTRVNGGLTLVAGSLFSKPNEIVIDTIYAESKRLAVGSKVQLLEQEFTVAGIFQSGKAARVLAPLATMQHLDGAPGKASLFFVKAKQGLDLDELVARINREAPGYKVTKTSDINEEMSNTVPILHEFIVGIVSISLLISFLIILLAMSTTVTERTREIGILRSLGASREYILRLVLKEAFLICLAGVGVGFVLTFVINETILVIFPMLPIDISTWWVLSAILVGMAGGPLGALYPALKAARQDPVEALSYE